jgi:hypothetical protein
MNSDTLDLGGERRGPARRGHLRGHRCGRGVPPTAPMQGEGDAERAALRTALIRENWNSAIIKLRIRSNAIMRTRFVITPFSNMGLQIKCHLRGYLTKYQLIRLFYP